MNQPELVEGQPTVVAPALTTNEQPEAEPESLRFDDPYWDDAFGSWCDPTLRTCCS